MRKRESLKFLSVIVLIALLPGMILARTPQTTEHIAPGSGIGVTLILTLPSYEIAQDEAGFDVIQAAGFSLSGEPGEVLLPRQVYNVAVPPNARFDSLSVQVISGDVAKLPGTYSLRLAVPLEPSAGFVDDALPYLSHSMSSSGPTPSDFVRLLPPSQMRKWRFARVEFSPFYYDASSSELTAAHQLTVRIDYTVDRSLSAQDTALMADDVMDDEASELLVNYDTAQVWYGSMETQDAPGAVAVYDYVIITTNAIQAGSSKLANFVSHKQSRGYSVLVITEDDYGSLTGQSPDGRAEKIRQWLIDNYVGYSIEYVLLIGDPDPDDPSDGGDSIGDVPMKMCWPNRNPSHPNYAAYPESPSDAFYADLTGKWDLDGDGYFGEYEDYTGIGGVDFANEVYVGRIPVYGGAYTTLDDILQKIMDYENEPDPANWRKSALLPMSYSDENTDGAHLAEQMKSVYLSTAGYSSWTMYQQGSGPCGDLTSTFGSDEELYGSSVVRNRWSAGDYGLALWWAHGSQTGAYIGYGGCPGGTLFSSSDTSYLDDDHPTFVYQNSCTNGYPERSDNLQYALLKRGAIGTVGATRVSWYSPGQTQFAGSTTNAGIGYEYAKRLVENDLPAGDALYGTKATLTPFGSALLMNFYDFNLYGDPSTGLTSTYTGHTHTVSGYVRDSAVIGIGGVTVSFAGARPAVTTNGSGYYYQSGFANGIYTVALSLDGYTFSPFEDRVTVSDADVIHDVTGYLENPHLPSFSDSFETGSLGSDWAAETNYEGRVRIDSSYPYSGTYSLLLDDDTHNSTYSQASVALPLNLTGCSEAQLSFWWRSFGAEAHADDGVFITDDDGETWNKAYSFTGNSPAYTQVSIDLIEATSVSAMSVDHRFQVKFQFYGNESIQTDGYAIDDISTDVTVEIHEVFLPVVMR